MNSYQDAINQYEAGGEKLQSALIGISQEELHAKPGPGTWSIHEVVIHLSDSDAIGIDRMRRILTEDNPAVLNYDETAYIERLHPEAQSIEDAVLSFKLGRRQFAKVLRLLKDEDFDRICTHNVDGKRTMADMVRTYIKHLDHHLSFITAKLERLR